MEYLEQPIDGHLQAGWRSLKTGTWIAVQHLVAGLHRLLPQAYPLSPPHWSAKIPSTSLSSQLRISP